eukprot:3863609-Rhodomonas_salina.1
MVCAEHQGALRAVSALVCRAARGSLLGAAHLLAGRLQPRAGRRPRAPRRRRARGLGQHAGGLGAGLRARARVAARERRVARGAGGAVPGAGGLGVRVRVRQRVQGPDPALLHRGRRPPAHNGPRLRGAELHAPLRRDAASHRGGPGVRARVPEHVRAGQRRGERGAGG